MEKLAPKVGYALAPEHDQPLLPVESVIYEGIEFEHRTDLYAVWLTQRSQVYFHSLSSIDKAEVAQMLGAGTATDLLHIPLTAKISRIDNRFLVGSKVV
jgi:hypothetical protein